MDRQRAVARGGGPLTLTSDGLPADRIEALVSGWEASAQGSQIARHTQAFWDQVVAWISAEQAAKRKPKGSPATDGWARAKEPLDRRDKP